MLTKFAIRANPYNLLKLLLDFRGETQEPSAFRLRPGRGWRQGENQAVPATASISARSRTGVPSQLASRFRQ